MSLKLFWLHGELRELGNTTWQARSAVKCSPSPSCFKNDHNIKGEIRESVGRRTAANKSWREESEEGTLKKKWFLIYSYVPILLSSPQPGVTPLQKGLSHSFQYGQQLHVFWGLLSHL
jgi:hypothetical protein